ncbi:universal stress protein [Nocardiopsis changdeensis]|uniref:Universal stress protein n=1 Tax=Nocardiopsis changdeensis TaxID=2831969 RepID=A0ABX8BFV4_9ACTN|nr:MULTISPECIES: universal stress protein [Nocardiopsis]QUX20650.1 universal stress protein [Nocardiopsis changdeensis]QYX36582.1 universal stress protein [Nocardiopsis sp. MT53]
MTRPILVGVDGSEPALGAVGWAAAEASRRGCGLLLLTAFAMPPAEAAFTLSAEEVRRGVDDVLDTARQRVRDTRNDVSAERAAVLDSPVKALLNRAPQAALVVVGLRGRGGVPGMKVGSVAYRVAAHSPAPVVVVGPEPREADERLIVTGDDGSPHGRRALATAFEEAALRGARVHVVRAWRPVNLPAPAVVGTSEEEQLEHDLAPLRAEHPDVQVDARVLEEHPVTALADAAQGAGLLVIGARGRHGFPRAALGSTAHGLLHSAPCPLMIVHAS